MSQTAQRTERRRARRADVRRPPGPGRGAGLPARNLLAIRRDPIGPLMSMARDYGDLAYFRVGPFDVYLVTHPDEIRDVLVTHNKRFMKGQALQQTKRLLGEGLLTSEGELHHGQRRLIQPIFHHQRVAEYGRLMVQDALLASDRWRDGQVLDIHREMTRLTLKIVGTTIFDADVEGEAAHVGRSLTVVMAVFNRLTNPFARAIERLPLPSNRRLQAALEDLNAIIDRMIAERRSKGGGGHDLLSMLLDAQDEEADGGAPNGGPPAMSDQQVKDEAMTLFLAGHETTAQLMTWAWYLLSKSPAAEATLHAELDSVLGDRPPTGEDIPSLPYTQMVLSEVLRLYPPAYVMGRRVVEEHRIAGYRIPVDATIVMSQYVTHHDARWFPEPFRFDPERWTEEAKASRPRYSYFPFGGGPRMCIGEGFAWMEAGLLLATLAQRWRMRVPESHLVELQPMITLRPKGGMPVRLERRS